MAERRDTMPLVTESSELQAPPAEVWERVISPEGINDELMPIMRMTMPPGVEGLDAESIVPGEKIGRSWILLFGLIPFDYDDIRVTSIEVERGFLEESVMLTQRYWRHERTLEPLPGGGTRVTDDLTWEPRLPIPARWLTPLIAFFFRHRHRQLRRHFND